MLAWYCGVAGMLRIIHPISVWFIKGHRGSGAYHRELPGDRLAPCIVPYKHTHAFTHYGQFKSETRQWTGEEMGIPVGNP